MPSRDKREIDQKLRWPTVARYVVLLLVLGLLVAYILPGLADIEESLRVARTLDWMFLVLAIVAQCLSYLSSADVLRSTVRLSGNAMGLGRAAMIEMAASTLCLVAGGVVGFAAAVDQWTKKSGVPAHAAVVAGFLPTLFSAASLLFFGVVSAGLLFGARRLSRSESVAVAIVGTVVAATILIGIAALARPGWLLAVLRWAGRIPIVRQTSRSQRARREVARVRDAISKLGHGAWRRPAVSAMLNFVFDSLTLALVFAATGARVGPITLLAGYGIPILLGRASLVPGGVAVTEVSLSALYISLGVKPSVVVVSILTYRLLTFWLPTLLGILLIVHLQTGRRTARSSG